MTSLNYSKTLFYLGLTGAVFSGVLGLRQLAGQTCTLSTSCALLLGYPACLFGLVVYVLLMIVGWFGLVQGLQASSLRRAALVFSGMGMLLAGWFAVTEMWNYLTGGFLYDINPPIHMYGLALFFVIFVISVRQPVELSGK